MRLTLPFLPRTNGTSNGGAAAAAPPINLPDETLFDEELLARLRRLVLLSRRSVAEGLAGEHRSRRRGASPEFADFKSYSQGDDFRRIDWNIYSRLDELFIRLSEVTTELTVHVLLDASNSMDWRGATDLPTKFTYARRVAGSLCYVSLWHFDRVVIVPFGSELGAPFGPSQGRSHVMPMLQYLTKLAPLGQTNLIAAVDRYMRARRRPGILVLVTDLLSGEPEELKQLLRDLRARGWQTIVVHFVDEAELRPALLTAGEPAELLEVESGQRLRLTPTAHILERYSAALNGWLEGVETVCNDEETDYIRLQTDWPFETIVLRMLHQRGLLAPLGLVSLIGLPLVVLYHMRHTTPVVKPVPTLRFWLTAVEHQTDEARFRRPPLTLLLLLHLIIVGALAFALTRPAATDAWAGLGHRTDPEHVIILLDGSTSMSATDTPSGRSRFDEARASALARVANLHEGDVATVVLLGTHPTTLEATDAAGLKALRDRLAHVAPPGGRADLNAALRLARDLVLPNLEDRIVLLSDGALTVDPTLVAAVGAPIEFQRIGRSTTPNLAITDLSARGAPNNPDREQLYARIVNFSDDAITTRFVVTVDSVVLEERNVEIAANAAAEEIVDELPEGASNVTVTVESDDAFQADNRASLALSRNADLGLHILLVSDNPGALQRALAVLPGSQVTTVSTTEMLTASAESTSEGPFDLVVYEGFTSPDGSYPDAPMLFAGPPRDGTIATRGVMPDPTVVAVSAQDPLLRGVELQGVTFGETPIHVLDATQTAVVSAEGGPLIYRGRVPATGQPMIVLAFDVNQSNLPQRVAFPILIANIAGELAPSPLPAAAPLGDPLRYRPRAGAATVRIQPPSGDSVDLSVAVQTADSPADASQTSGNDRLREVVYADTGRAGAYTITELDAAGNAMGGGTFVVNAGHARESDLRMNPDLPDVLANARATEETGTNASLADLWPALVMFAVAVLGLEWLWSVLPRRRARQRVAASQAA
jgi:uncharacterized protein (DUF58 family)